MFHHLNLADDRPTSRPAQRGTVSPCVTVGEKEFYDWTNPADAAEYRTVREYRQR